MARSRRIRAAGEDPGAELPFVSTTLPPVEDGYWTEERMRNAVPAGPRVVYPRAVLVSGAVFCGVAVMLVAVLIEKLRRSG
ncbi:hypothetical protein SAMN02982929_04107 [Saccharopolyspora kobensis]|uniref:DUF5808 domain-containing protein n=1 Tax=Saccharopolyspora kobensis TaxID=146035 RepID=A0A1H6DCQ1_9PSEU|nr:hypothetical protein SAMN02982929_04107 [Saccharopolyspora kobensis]